MSGTPLLSVLVPTYQRSALLRVMLQTLLPQVADCDALVEVCIADNASGDDTAAVVAEACAMHPRALVTVVRRERNVGPVRNYVHCATEQARGEFIWALGDDDLLLPGALQRICTAIRAHPQVRHFYTNFACADFASQWPASAHGGYTGSIIELACAHTEDRPVRYWQELLDASSSMGTQVYAHIAPRDAWTRFWHGRTIAPDYRSLESTYPHTCMLIETAWDQPAVYLGMPAVVQFNGRAGWADGQGARIVLVSFPRLIALLDDRGLGLHTLLRARKDMEESLTGAYRSLLTGPGGAEAAQILHESLVMGTRYPELIRAVVTAIQTPGAPLVPALLEAVRDALSALQPQRAAA